jgi:beta-glucosidase
MSRSAFLWGAAVSAHQTEGENQNSDWWRFERDVLQKRGGDASGRADDHWTRYKEDIDLLADAGLNAFRFSIEWAKVEPKEGEYDKRALDHYADVLKHLKKRNIASCVTLWHFTLPAWAADKGGMLNRSVRRRFYLYADACAERFGKDVDIWTTINEPMVYLMEGYHWGTWPPRLRSAWKQFRVFFALRMIHRRCYVTLKRRGARSAGMAKSIIVFECADRANAMHRIVRAWKNFFWNRAFFLCAERFHDYVGVNFYITETVGPKDGTHEKDDMGWEIRPHGLEAAVREAGRIGKPIYVLENGIATRDDAKRIAYIESRVRGIERAKKEGIDLRGYFHWSLLDNFEWTHGYSKRFGLVAVDRKTMERNPKPSLRAYAGMIKRDYGRFVKGSKDSICF